MCKVSLISSNKSSGIPITSLHLKALVRNPLGFFYASQTPPPNSLYLPILPFPHPTNKDSTRLH